MQQNRNIIHTDCSRIERERDEKKNAQTDLRGSPWVRLRPWEGKTKSFFVIVAVYKWKLLLYGKYKASLPYIGKG